MKTMTSMMVLALAVAPASLRAQQKLDEKRSAARDGVVEIESAAGSIHVIGWNRAEVTVTGTLGPGAEGLEISGGSHRTQISVETDRNPHGVNADLEIHVPAGSRIEINSFAATIAVSEVTGAVTAEGVNSSISVAGGSKEVSAQTVNGTVDVSGATGRVHAESVNGAVTVKGVKGSIEASTTNGRLVVTGGTLEHVGLETVSGPIRFEGDLTKAASIEAQTVSGNVDLVLPATISADFSLTTFSGDIQSDFGGAARRPNKHTSQKELEFTTGDGDAKVEVQTLSGAIVIKKRP
jgi:DUF4097 and DUF4098 domain-containing protein YvlB